MDSLKLDKFRKLLNRQNTSLSIGGGNTGEQATNTNQQSGRATTVTNSNANITSLTTNLKQFAPSSNGGQQTANSATQTILSAITASLPDYVTKDNPKPAHFIARKLFSDFTELANRKIELILVQRHDPEQPQQQQQQQKSQQLRDKPLFRPLQRDEDLIYDQILKALGAISEYCLPSLLELLLQWYDLQIEAYTESPSAQHSTSVTDNTIGSATRSLNHQDTSPSLDISQQQQQQQPPQLEPQPQPQQEPSSDNNRQEPFDCGCVSPCNNESHSLSNSVNNSAIRSPTPDGGGGGSKHEQITITSSLPLDYQSPAPQTMTTTIVHRCDKDESSLVITNQQQQATSAANTSTSTGTNTSLNSTTLEDSITMSKRLELTKTRALLVEYTFCQALIEIFGKLYLHPGHGELIGRVEDMAFGHFKSAGDQEQDQQQCLSASDIKRLADKYAEVIGVLAQTRFRSIKKRFLHELNELQASEATPLNIHRICLLLTSMKYFRVKMAQIEEFEASFSFLQELADYFIEVRHKSIKHALADLFVEIMLPVASIVKNEVKIPCLKNFVDTLWAPTLDMCARKKHSSTLFPLVTCLLCVSQRALFLQNWSPFLVMCLSNLKNRDQKMCRIALDSLYRLIWIYMLRVRGESNNITQTRLTSIVDSLFPRGSRQVVPRDTPLIIFVDIIQFIAQERLDFALRHIIFDLLSVDRPIKMIMAPERMNIGLQAFLVIADNLQQKEGDPTMPITIGSASAQQLAQIMQQSANLPPSSSPIHHHQVQDDCNGTYGQRRGASATAQRMLNDETAKSIGLHPYHQNLQKSFNEILKILDAQFGRPLMLTASQNVNKEADEMIKADRKPKVDLFKTCIAAIPRLMPDGMSRSDLIDLLSRMTIHIDEEMRKHAFNSLKTLVTEFQDWRLDAIEGFTLFLANQIDESLRQLVDSALKMLLQLLVSWHTVITSCQSHNQSSSSSSSKSLSEPSMQSSSAITSTRGVSIQTGYETISARNSGAGGQIAARKNRALAEMRLIQSELSNTRFDRLVNVIQKVEGASLVMLCSCHNATRKLASLLLRECRSILRCYSSWTCMEQFGFRSPDDAFGDCEQDDSMSVVSLKNSLSADNLSRVTTTSINGGLVASSMTSMNTAQAMLSTSVSKMCLSSGLSHLHNTATTATTATSTSGGNNQTSSHHQQQQQQQGHDLYDDDIEANLVDCYAQDDNSTLILWFALIMLDSERESEYTFALRLLRKILPKLPFEQQDFLDDLERQLTQMGWSHFPGIHALVLKGCASPTTYDLCVSLLDHMTPILRHYICTATNKPEDCLPFHVLVLTTHLLATYEHPTPYSQNIARRLALCCEENSQKLENLSAVMTLYSRRSFSKDAFQWIKCIAKYLNDACPHVLPEAITFLIDLLEGGPIHVQQLILPILYCILTYVDINTSLVAQQNSASLLSSSSSSSSGFSPPPSDGINADLMRMYTKCIGSPPMWRDAMQIFKLIISKSSSLTNQGTTTNQGQHHELPGRTMDFTIELDNLPVIAKAHLAEFGIHPGMSSTTNTSISTPSAAIICTSASTNNNNNNNNVTTATSQQSSSSSSKQQQQQQQQLEQQHSLVDSQA